jgi:hypothetical protein
VIDVEADRPDDAPAIAKEIVTPLRDRYEEVLVYVRPIGSPANTLTRRIEWTPGGGFVETKY